jgi:hypothetical protein
MEQTTSLLLWALHGTNNITSSMGIAWNKQHHFFYGHLHGTNNITSSMDIAWNKQHHFLHGHCKNISIICWIHDLHQNIKKSSNAAAGASTFLGHNNFLQSKIALHLPLLASGQGQKTKQKQNKTKKQNQTFNGWICLSMQGNGNLHCLYVNISTIY